MDVTDNVFTYERIVHRPRIVLPLEASEADQSKAERLAHKAEASCMISRAVAGNVAMETRPVIVTTGADAV